MLRKFILPAFLLLAVVVFGQQSGLGIMMFEADQPMNSVDQKKAYAALYGLDPAITISFDSSLTMIKIRPSETSVSAQQVVQALSSFGINVVPIVNGLTSQRSGTVAPWAAGYGADLELTDPQQYAIAKEQWILDHPEEYEQLMAPANSEQK